MCRLPSEHQHEKQLWGCRPPLSEGKSAELQSVCSNQELPPREGDAVMPVIHLQVILTPNMQELIEACDKVLPENEKVSDLINAFADDIHDLIEAGMELTEKKVAEIVGDGIIIAVMVPSPEELATAAAGHDLYNDIAGLNK